MSWDDILECQFGECRKCQQTRTLGRIKINTPLVGGGVDLRCSLSSLRELRLIEPQADGGKHLIRIGKEREDTLMGYIKVPKVYEKLKKAEDFFVPVIMTAATGWGKSAAVEYYYRRKAPVVLACRGGNITKMPSPDLFRGHVVVIEDMQWLFEEESIRYLRGLLHIPGLQVVMLTRGGTVPKYLAAEDMDLRFMRIQERDFAFGENEVQAFFADRGIAILPEDAVQVAEASHGYVRAVHCYASRMEGGQRYSEEMKSAVWQDIYRL